MLDLFFLKERFVFERHDGECRTRATSFANTLHVRCRNPGIIAVNRMSRGLAFAPHADLLWMETAKPNLREARAFAEGVHAVMPHQKLAYNLSPSFNWDAAGMSKREMTEFNHDLGRLGFVWQVKPPI